MDKLSQGRTASASTPVARSLTSAMLHGFASWPRAVMPGALLLAGIHTVAHAQTPLMRVGTNVCGEQPDAMSRQVSSSGDGQMIAFTSSATNIVSSDTNGVDDVFIYDKTTNTTYLVSLSGSTQGNGNSDSPSIDEFGSHVAFSSVATNLVTGTTGRQVFLWTRTGTSTGMITLVSHNLAGLSGNGVSAGPAISADARWVVFYSYASDLVAGDVNGKADAFVYDTSTGVITLVSLANGSVVVQGNQDSYPRDITASPDISVTRSDLNNGPLVAFQSKASNLAPNDTNNARDVFVRDVLAATTTLVSISTTGFSGNGDSSGPDINQVGLFVAFLSDASDLITGDTNSWTDVFVRNLAIGATTRVSVSSSGAQGTRPLTMTPAYEFMPMISYRGVSVSFDSDLASLVTNEPVLKENVFLRDLLLGSTTLMSINSTGNGGNGDSLGNSLAQNDLTSPATSVSLQSAATDLIYFDLNGLVDVFTPDPGTQAPFTNYCFGDGSGTACPCANTGSAGHGCNNFQNTGGGTLYAYGSPSLAQDSLGLQANDLPGSTFMLFYQGTNVHPASGPSMGLGTQFGDGLQCVGGTIARLATKSVSGSATYSICLGDTKISTQGGVPGPGSTRYYQGWYRQAVMYCTGSTFNTTNALTVVWGP